MTRSTYPVDIAIIGGTGLYSLPGLEVMETLEVETPWGAPSSPITISRVKTEGVYVAFIARHGLHHTLNPTEVPYRANIAALKHLGARVVLSFSAVGSLREELAPGHFILPSQCIDRTKGLRPHTFFEGGAIAHVGFADPYNAGKCVHKDKTLVCMEGPAFSTRAESHMYRAWGGDVINMSGLPEAKLAREAQLAYQTVCMSTDYDCWRQGEEAVNVTSVMEVMKENGQNASALVLVLIPALAQAIKAGDGGLKEVEGIISTSCLTPLKDIPEGTRASLHYLHPEHF
ncbi:putative 5'-methylthioadenosine phosphorylase [Piptocephalis cylindrospora]|uniref:S-methyl-5'-thioadenosine phosphorylase n=1 Tax=Piptocephalis cylindrospora TaxID=1907219 RepID=A0A4V1IYA7_9FUNG|nr:putative 5'-methylthioadenosine phosphorylase [Piptocephalis cylindrospora]|eukprot:RKP13899.1 putative 5'-methylthioadenosine phosphorylase [Piptocephalis cylindrospora]